MLMKKKEGLLKRLKNIEDRSKITEENKDSQLRIKSIGYTVRENLSKEAKYLLEKRKNQEKLITTQNLILKEVIIVTMILVITVL